MIYPLSGFNFPFHRSLFSNFNIIALQNHLWLKNLKKKQKQKLSLQPQSDTQSVTPFLVQKCPTRLELCGSNSILLFHVVRYDLVAPSQTKKRPVFVFQIQFVLCFTSEPFFHLRANRACGTPRSSTRILESLIWSSRTEAGDMRRLGQIPTPPETPAGA